MARKINVTFLTYDVTIQYSELLKSLKFINWGSSLIHKLEKKIESKEK